MIICFERRDIIRGWDEIEVWTADSKVHQQVAHQNEENKGDDDSAPSLQGQMWLERRILGDALMKRRLRGWF